MSKNVFKQQFSVTSEQRNKLNRHNSFVIWFTGLPGSGKSTLANALEIRMYKKNIRTMTLDGDNIRRGINSELGFSEEEREENLRRIAYISKIMIDAGVVCLSAFVSPLNKYRSMIKTIVGEGNFVEVFVNTPNEICEKRDVKGLYAKARKGEINDFTGVNAPFENPLNPDIVIDNSNSDIEASVDKLFDFIEKKLVP